MADSLFSNLVHQASTISGLDLLKIMKNEHGELGQTVYLQPALVTVSYGLYRMLERDLPDLPIGGIVGLSLGEYAGLLASKAVSFTAGIRLLGDRAKYMQAVTEELDSGLAAIIDPDIAAIEDLVSRQGKVFIANYNSPRQIVIGGMMADLKQTASEIKQADLAKRAVVLKVSGAFHTPLFNPARQQMEARVRTVDFDTPQLPLISNTTIAPFTAADIGPIMGRQLAVPTHFGAGLAYLVDNYGVDATIEIGPGKTLTRFARQVNPDLTTKHIETMADYQKFIEEYHNGTNK